MMNGIQIKDHIRIAICESLEIQHIQGGSNEEKNTEGKLTIKNWIDYIWIATIKGYYSNYVTVGSAAFRPHLNANAEETVRRGFLIVSGQEEGSFMGMHPFRSIPIGSTDDPIPNLLRQINLIPPVQNGAMDAPEDRAYFEIHTFFEGGCAGMTFRRARLPSDPNGKALWIQLMTLTDRLANMQDDPEIKTFIKENPYRYF